MPCRGDPSGDAPHRFVAEIGALQRFNKEGGLHPELGEGVEQKTQSVFLAPDRPQNDRFRDWGQLRILEIAADAEFGVDRDADFSGLSSLHDCL